MQGLGAALLVPCSLALLNHAAQGHAGARARAVSLWTASGSVALAAGPIIGGILVAGVGWRNIFFVNVPLGAIGIWLTLRRVDETHPGKSASICSVSSVRFGFAALTPLDANTPYLAMLAGLLILPIGIGLVVPAMTTALLASVEKERSGIASGVLNTVRQAGGALGIAVLGSFLAAHGTAGLRVSFIVSAALMLAVVAVAVLGLRDAPNGERSKA